jgi:hypothetical protein
VFCFFDTCSVSLDNKISMNSDQTSVMNGRAVVSIIIIIIIIINKKRGNL